MPLPDLPRFYHPDIVPGTTLRLDEEECRHAKVLRLTTGEDIHLVNGQGKLFLATISHLKKHLEVMVNELLLEEQPSERTLSLAVAPTKNINRMEWVVEKAVEVGVHEIIPIQCEHSERVHLKRERLERIALSAMKQSKTLWMPRIHDLTPFETLLNADVHTKWIAHCKEGLDRTPLRSLAEVEEAQLVCIGPEGDFSDDEISDAIAAGFQGLSLGEQRLRTETAAIAVCIGVNLFHA